ncbi:MAG: hypothetical protein P8M53_03330 [Pirellulales bacterium]|nr:hypothetical protein [Pirellulales bacterium]
MASGSTVPGDSNAVPRNKRREILPGYIEDQLERTSSEVRLIELSISILTLCVATLSYLLVLGILEHWFIAGGLSTVTRTLLLIGLVASLIFYARHRLFPYLRYRISLAYAAHTIEQSEPRLKNSLLNFLFLRRQKKGVSHVVLRGLEQQAATGLSRVSADLSVERKRLTHLGIVVIAIILFGALYTIFSPKSLAPEVGRMLLPWADIDAATRVKIENVQPGSKKVTLRSKVNVSAEIKGLREGDPVAVVFSSAGGGAVDRRLPMHADSGSENYARQIAESEGGIVSDLTYHIEAGDAVSKEYQLEVIPAPSFQVQSIEYQYPPYTGLESRTVREVGDVRAIEGTRVGVNAQSTGEIAVATLHLGGNRDGLKGRTLRMEVNGNRAACQFVLRRKQVDSDSIPEYSTYHLSLKTPSGDVNENKVRHQISILRDQPPVVEILTPQESAVEVREDDALSFEVRGRDPDFRLTELWLVGHQGERERFKIDLLGRSKRIGEPLRAVHRETTRFIPRDWGLRAGETVSVFAVAIDNKQPHANRSETSSLQVRILPPLPGSQQEKSSPSADRNGESSPEQNQTDESDGQSESREQEKTESDGGRQDGGGESAGEDSTGSGNASGQEQGGQSETNNQSGGGQSNQQNKSEGDPESGSGQSSNAQGSGEQSGQSPSTPESGEERGKSSSNRGDSPGEPQEEDQGSSAEQSAEKSAEKSEANGNKSPSSASNQQTQNAEQSPGEGARAGERSGTETTENSKVDNDGDAFEQLNEIIQEKSTRDGQASSNPSDNSSTSQTPSPGTEDAQDKSTDGSSTDGGKQGASSSSKQDSAQESQSEQAQSEQSQSEQSQSEQAQSEQDSGKSSGSGSEPNPEQKREGTGQRDRIGESNENASSETERSSDAAAEASRDETGGGTGNTGEQPPPPGEGLGQDRRKSGSTQQDSQQEEEPSDGGVSKRDSDSAQGQEGSRHGKGQEGGGQQSQQEGEGAAGANTPADAGKGSAAEPGQGESGSEAGSNEQSGQSEQPTGQSGTQPGEGSRAGPADSASNDTSKTSKGKSGSASSTPSQQSEAGTPPPQDGGGGGLGSQKPEELDGLNEPGADNANLDYAKETTDLVLDYLEKQLDQGGIDEDLKKQFGWTDREFTDFVRRYRNLKQEAQLPGKAGEKAKSKWGTVLRSLGLTPPQRDARTTSAQVDRKTGLRESGRSLPPQEDQNRFDAFRRDVLGR